MRLSQKISRRRQQLRQCVDAVLLQSNEDRTETKFYLARALRRLKLIRFLAAKLAVLPPAITTTTIMLPVERAKLVLDEVEVFEATLAPFLALEPDLPLDFMAGHKKYPGKD